MPSELQERAESGAGPIVPDLPKGYELVNDPDWRLALMGPDGIPVALASTGTQRMFWTFYVFPPSLRRFNGNRMYRLNRAIRLMAFLAEEDADQPTGPGQHWH